MRIHTSCSGKANSWEGSAQGHGICPWSTYPLVEELRQIKKKKQPWCRYKEDCDNSPRKVLAGGNVSSGDQRQMEPVFKMGQIIYCKGSSFFKRNLVFRASWFERQKSQRSHRSTPAFTLGARRARHIFKMGLLFSGFLIMMQCTIAAYSSWTKDQGSKYTWSECNSVLRMWILGGQFQSTYNWVALLSKLK